MADRDVDLAALLADAIPRERVRRDAPLAPFTTFKVGGPADWLVHAQRAGEVKAALAAARAAGLPVTVLGGGSNVLVADGGVRGLVIRIHGGDVQPAGEHAARADGGLTINGLVRWTINRGLAGLEAWAGTPGTVGGAIYGNAHFKGRLISELVESVEVVDASGHEVRIGAADMEFGYDRSRLQRTRELVFSADFRVGPGEPAALRAVARDSLAYRKRTQPLESASAGCIFQNPDPAVDRVPDGIPASAGALVDRAGLKGYRDGAARVSPTHGNFIVNDGGATAEDIRRLIERCRAEVRAQFGVELRDEIVYLGIQNFQPFVRCQMASLKIEGGRALSGKVTVEGNKNSALPLIAACMLTEQPCEIANVPRIRDVDVLLDLLEALGATVEGKGSGTLRIQCARVTGDRPDPVLVGRLRGSVLLLGPLLARIGSARLAPPGGDFPARRTIVTHLDALMALGAVPLDEPGHAMHAPKGLKGASFYLDEASVTGTETALLAASAAEGSSEIRHAAMEPHVVELCEFLQAMGVGVEGVGSSTLRVHPAAKRSGARHRLAGDYIEAGSWGVVAAITNGEIEVTGARSQDLEVICAPLKRMGLDCSYDRDTLVVRPSRLHAVRKITTGLWPGFPSDLVSLVTVLATQAEGRTLVHDWLHELRLFALEQMSAMRADLFLCDPHRIIVNGPTKLRGRALDSRDLRSGMALIAAALAAEGESRVAPLETVERGYASLIERLRSLGAQVERV